MVEYRQNANWCEEDHPRDEKGRFTEGTVAGLSLPDEYLHKSVGTKYSNLEITGPDGRKWHVLEGTYIRNKELIAGQGHSVQFRKANFYANTIGGKPEDWRKVKGLATIESEDGNETINADIHWVEADGFGKYDGKIKREL